MHYQNICSITDGPQEPEYMKREDYPPEEREAFDVLDLCNGYPSDSDRIQLISIFHSDLDIAADAVQDTDLHQLKDGLQGDLEALMRWVLEMRKAWIDNGMTDDVIDSIDQWHFLRAQK